MCTCKCHVHVHVHVQMYMYMTFICTSCIQLAYCALY